jgi:hypothetical protein
MTVSRVGSSQNGQRSGGSTPKVVQVLQPIRESQVGRPDVRVIEVRPGERRLDVRQYINCDTFTGYSRRGICVTAEEIAALVEQLDAIEDLLAGRGAPTVDRQWSAEAMS